MAETIKIGGELESTATGNKVADVANIKDKTQGNKSQAQINAEFETALDDRYTKSETYNKTELNNMITTPNQKYVTVTATDQTTSATDVLPATGEADTVYRVGDWDGIQFDASVYSEYAWNGSQYVHLSTKTQIGEVFDISAYHATGGTLATYADLSAALDSNNGGGVPQSLQRGGMSVKYVRTYDNKYVKFFCTADEFTTDVTQWQGVGDKLTAGSQDLVKSTDVWNDIDDVSQTLNGVNQTTYSGTIGDDNIIKATGGSSRYKVWHIKGGDVITYNGSSTFWFYIVNDFDYNPILPYTLHLATGETGKRVTGSSKITITTPLDAKYLILNGAVQPTLFTINGRDALSGLENIILNTQNELYKRIWIIVGQGAWQNIGKTDWKVGDKYVQYVENTCEIREVTSVSNEGATVTGQKSLCNAPEYALYVMNERFYTYKGGETLSRLQDIQDILSMFGDFTDLDTTDKSNLVAAINEVVAECVKIGDLSNLHTTDKTSVVDAVNEIADKFVNRNSIEQQIRVGKYWNTSGITIGSSFTGNNKNVASTYSVELITCQEGDVFEFYGIVNNANVAKTYVICDANDVVLAISNISTGTDYRTTPYTIVIPANGLKLYVNLYNYDAETDKLVKVTEKTIDISEIDSDVDKLEDDVEELKKLPLYGKTIVCFGDSMTEFSLSTKKRYSDYLADITGANVINVGIGGTRLAQRATPSLTPDSRLQAISALDICNLVKASVEQDFSLQDAAMAYLANIEDPIAGKIDIINRLKSIDWSVVDVVTVCGGANDWMSNVNLGEEDSANLGEALGGLNYILQSLTYTYPKIRVFYFAQIMLGTDANLRSGASNAFNKNHAYIVDDDVFYDGKLWRFTSAHQGEWSNNDARRITQAELQAMGSDVVTNADNLTFKQYTRALIECSTNNHIPTCDMYMTMWNMNQLPSVMHADFHHPLNGMEQIAEKLYGFISANRNFDM